MASLFRSILRLFGATEPLWQLHDLTDDVLKEILLRIATLADLVRASAACVSFRRLITDPSFLRRYCSLHRGILLGFLYHPPAGFQPAEAPHPNAPAARALDRAARFSFDYLPRGTRYRWYPRDVYSGRVLLMSRPSGYDGVVVPDLVVCDPLSRRYLLLPPIPDDLLACAQLQEHNLYYFEAFLAPSGAEEDEASFRVIGRADCMTKLVVFLFSSASGCWSIGPSSSWEALSLSVPPEGLILSWLQRAYGCFYWKVNLMNKLLKLNMNRMEFSTIDLPPDHSERDVVIVEAAKGRIGMFSHIKYDTSVYRAIWRNEGENVNEWQVENTVPLPILYNFCMASAAEGYIFLVGFPKHDPILCSLREITECFSLEIKTLKIERVSRMRFHSCSVYPYFGFPPSMSATRI